MKTYSSTIALSVLLTLIGSKIFGQSGDGKIPLVNPSIISERINGPANVRDRINGNILLQVYDNIPVSTADSSQKWYPISLEIDLTENEVNSGHISRDALVYVKGMEAARALRDIPIDKENLTKSNGHYSYLVLGYTSVRNIHMETQPENVLTRLIATDTNLDVSSFKDYIKGFRFSQAELKGFSVFQLDDGPVSGPSSPMRLMLVFYKDKLIGVVHLRKLVLPNPDDRPIGGNYNLAVMPDQDQAIIKQFIARFNTWLQAAG